MSSARESFLGLMAALVQFLVHVVFDRPRGFSWWLPSSEAFASVLIGTVQEALVGWWIVLLFLFCRPRCPSLLCYRG